MVGSLSVPFVFFAAENFDERLYIALRVVWSPCIVIVLNAKDDFAESTPLVKFNFKHVRDHVRRISEGPTAECR